MKFRGGTTPESRGPSAITLRAIVLGVLLILATNIWGATSEHYLRSSYVGVGVLSMSVFLPFLLTVIVLNVLLKALRGYASVQVVPLSPGELIVVFIMAFAGNSAGWSAWMVACLATPYYFATSENQWAEYFHEHIPKWLVPSSEGNAMEWFYGGLPEAGTMPWEVWAVPLFWWFTLILASITASACLVSIMRRQWVEQERLAFPLCRVPVIMTQGSDDGRLLPEFMRGKVFWIGFSIPMFVILWNVASYFNPQFPRIPIGHVRYMRLARYFPAVRMRVNFFLIGLGYLANLDVLFSIWFFHFLALVQIGLYNRFGVQIGPASYWSHPWWLVRFQGTGGYVVMSAWALWLARKHVSRIAKLAWTGEPHERDGEELMSPRAALLGFVGSCVFVAFWFRCAGITWVLLLLYMLIAFLFSIGVAKFIAESGLVYLGWPFSARQFAIFLLGTANCTPGALTAMSVCAARGIFGIVGFAHIAKLGEHLRCNRRALVGVMAGATLLGCVVAVGLALYLGYTYGAYNTGHWTYVRGNVYHYNRLVKYIKASEGPDWAKNWLVLGGASLTAAMMFMRYHFPWFHLHPLGFTIATMWPVRTSAVSILIVWFAKLVLLKIGGIQLARKALPFFIGILIGYSLGVGISFAVDAVWFPGAGHWVHAW